MTTYNTKALIVWIDDYFLSDEFIQSYKKTKSIKWNTIFSNIESKIYRLLDINIKFLSTKEEFYHFLQENNFNSNTYFYFIVDRRLPSKIGEEEAYDSNSVEIITELKIQQSKYKCLDFSVLSAGSPDSYEIKDVDYYIKPHNQEFTLPSELKHKILLKIKENISFINQYSFFEQDNFIIDFGKNNDTNNNADINQLYLYPFIDKFKTFVELEEISAKNFKTLIAVTDKSVSDGFIKQSILVSLFDNLKSHYKGIKYYNYDSFDYIRSNKDNSYKNIQEEHQYISVFRLKKWDIESYKELFHMFRRNNLLAVFIIDSEDENIQSYMEESKNTKVIKIESIKETDKELAKYITFAILSKIINDKKDINLLDNIYSFNLKLLLHPVIYRLITDKKFNIPKLDDPNELIILIQKYMEKLLNGRNNDNIKSQLPIDYPNEYIYDLCKEATGENYQDFLISTIKYWLSNSWNTNYNISMSKDKEKWQKKSYEILKELLKKISIKNIKNEIDKEYFKQINKTIEVFENKNFDELSYRIIWPHEKYPVPIYIQNQILDNKTKSKKLYFQNKNFHFISCSDELKTKYKLLEDKLDFYRDIFDLMDKTIKHFPDVIQPILAKIINRIKNSENVFKKEDKDEFNKLANILLRISSFFGEEIIAQLFDEKRIDIDYEDKGGLGKLLSFYRDNVLNKNRELFMLKKEFSLEKYKDFVFIKENNAKLLNRQIGMIFDLLESKNIKKEEKLSLDSEEYLDKLYLADNINTTSQIITLASIISNNEHFLQLYKYKDGYKLLAYLTDTRNIWAHKNDLWDNELFIKFFIYSYEGIWLMHKFMLENLDKNTKYPDTKYISLNKKYIFSNIRFKSKDEYLNKLNKLYKEDTEILIENNKEENK